MNIQVGVKLLIKNGTSKYLFIQRNAPLPDGTGIKWDIPGGRVKLGETLSDALMREVKEEIGIDFTAEPNLLIAQDIIIPDVNLHVLRLTYTIKMDADITLSREHQAMKWLTLEEARDIDVDPYLRALLDTL